jgi:hypothetical protein
MADFKLDPVTRDLDVSSGLQIVTEGDEAAQRVSLSVGLNLGEWFLNINYGLPWIKNNLEDLPDNIQYMLGSKKSDIARFIDSTITQYLKSQEFIKTAKSTYTYEAATRSFTYLVDIVTKEGEALSLTPFQTQI